MASSANTCRSTTRRAIVSTFRCIKQIAWRAHHPADDAGKADFKGLLARGMVRPTRLDLWVMDADGQNQRPLSQFSFQLDGVPARIPDSEVAGWTEERLIWLPPQIPTN